MSRHLCLITGASSGLGAAMARVFASHGWDVALTARRGDRLKALAEEIRLRFGVETYVFALDLANPETPKALIEGLTQHGRHVDALVNNAGYGLSGRFIGHALKDHQDFLQVMQQAPVELVHRVLPGILERRFGRIINVASLSGYLPGSAGDTLYGPVKSFLIRFSQGLHLETRDQDVYVTALCPGLTYTEFHDADGSRSKVTQATSDWMWMGADEVAAQAFEAVEANRAVCVTGAPNSFLSILLKMLPDVWVMEMIARYAVRLGRL